MRTAVPLLQSAWTKAARSVFVLVLIVACASPPVNSQTLSLTEEQIKAGFLFNFTKFVEWPSDRFADSMAPIVLGIVGETAVAKLLADVAVGKSVNGRPVVVKQLKEGQELKTCHIVFVSDSEEKRVHQVLEILKGTSTLTVGETPGFIQAGGMINFFTEENKVRLEMNLEAASHVRVKISAKVIAVARLTPQDSSRGKS
jgi:hypothetical protein